MEDGETQLHFSEEVRLGGSKLLVALENCSALSVNRILSDFDLPSQFQVLKGIIKRMCSGVPG